MPEDGLVVPGKDLDGLTPKPARLYASADPRVLSRDLNELEKNLGLISRVGRGYRARSEVILALMPPVAANDG